ncbi:uncharacterized protein LTR77_009251 [Saxophila tyrrhenica]|uniref:Uncharacterized protein n=1 Tax=Saxophila tyrrhenica TaxID=1690608 RepID=A0AAV9P2N9_9PEZI|nr:hypothetical protein LTR77_009251 [Saxophila tyrrhenica]
MLAIQPPTPPSNPSKTRKLTPNLLPCAIKHSGPISIHPRYWAPTTSITTYASANGVNKPGQKTSTSYFRGRKLLGSHVPLPSGYHGLVLSKTERVLPVSLANDARAGAVGHAELSIVEKLRRMEGEIPPTSADDEDDDDKGGLDEPLEVKILEEQARFEEVVVWGHETPVGEEDEFVRGLGEWLGFAGAIHAYDDEPKQGKAAT